MPLKTADFDYELPPELIAQQPLDDRTAARMMVVDRAAGSIAHLHVRDLPDALREGDLLVVNRTRVIPARLFGTRPETGGRVEVLLIEPAGDGTWAAFYRASRPPREGRVVVFAEGELRGEVVAVPGRGRVRMAFSSRRPLPDVLQDHGVAPLPPYIKRPAERTASSGQDIARYQTMFAAEPGAVAAPTAGLHFTPDLMDACRHRGIDAVSVTLHVGPGTFTPVTVDDVREHAMESERYEIDDNAAAAIREAHDDPDRRVVAVGSTTVRTCETVAAEHGRVVACRGRSELFIHPPFTFRVTEAMLTNFHLPRSTLLMMVGAFTGMDLMRDAYHQAASREYRFYSYGDCMIII